MTVPADPCERAEYYRQILDQFYTGKTVAEITVGGAGSTRTVKYARPPDIRKLEELALAAETLCNIQNGVVTMPKRFAMQGRTRRRRYNGFGY